MWITKPAALTILFILIVIIGLVAATGMFSHLNFGKIGVRTAPSSTFLVINSSALDANSTLGLSLELFVTPSNSSAGQLLNVSAEVVNTRNVANNVSDVSDWLYPASALNPFSPCGIPGQVGFGILQGYYDENNYSKATSILYLYNVDETYNCTAGASFTNVYFSFNPNSDSAQVIESSGGELLINVSISISDAIGGYWLVSSYRTFPVGDYTIIAADGWGQLVLLHFKVQGS